MSDARIDEPQLPELAQLRQLSEFEVPPTALPAEVLSRTRATLAARRAPKPGTRWRPVLLAALVLVAVPSAFAATPLGARWLGELTRQPPAPEPPGRAPTVEQPAAARASERAPAPLVRSAPLPRPAAELTVPRSRAPAGREPLGAPPAPPPPSPATIDPSVQAFPEVTLAPPTHHGHSTALEAEGQLLRQARLRLAAHDAHGALRWAAEHRRRFPQGVLAKERSAIEQQAHALASENGGR